MKLSNLIPAFNIRPVYQPGMVNYGAGDNNFNDINFGPIGSRITHFFQFRHDPYAADDYESIFGLAGTTYYRLQVLLYGTGYTTDTDKAGRIEFVCRSTTNVDIARVYTPANLADGELHSVFFQYHSGTGDVVLIVDGEDVLNTSHPDHVATTGTLESGAGGDCYVGKVYAADTNYYTGDLGFLGHRDGSTGITWDSFFWNDGMPKELDTTTWTEFNGTQPEIFAPNGYLPDHLGSKSFAASGTLVPAESYMPIPTKYPYFGTPARHEYSVTNGDAESGDMTGWTASIGTGMEALDMSTVAGMDPYEGSYSFGGANQLEAESYQDIALVAGPITSSYIDAGNLFLELNYVIGNYNVNDCARCYIKFYDESAVLLADDNITPPFGLATPGLTWQEVRTFFSVPVGARTARLYMGGRRTDGTYCNSHVDAITVTAVTK